MRPKESSGGVETRWKTPKPSTMAEIVLDTNVLVALLDGQDSLATRAEELTARMRALGHTPVLLDVVVTETVSVLARRAAERKANPPDLAVALDQVREWVAKGEVAFVCPAYR